MVGPNRTSTLIYGKARMHSGPVHVLSGISVAIVKCALQDCKPAIGVESFRSVVPLFCALRVQGCPREVARCVTLDIQVGQYIPRRRKQPLK